MLNLSQINLLGGNLFLLELFNFLVFSPILFHSFIIPRIKKRLGVKIKYTDVFYKLQVFSKWFYAPFDISNAIVGQYISWRISGEPSKTFYRSKNPYNPLALAGTNYDIRDSSFLEIGAAFFVWLNMWIFIFLIIGNAFHHFIK